MSNISQQALSLFRAGDFHQAKTLLENEQNKDANMMTLLGIALAGSNEPEKAAETFYQAHMLSGRTSQDAYLLLEPYLSPHNLYPAIINTFKNGLYLTPNDAVLAFTYAKILSHVGQYAKTVNILKKLLHSSLDQNNVLNELGWIFFNAGKYQIVLKIYKKLEKRLPDNVITFINLASYYNATNQTELSFQYYRKAILLHPHFARLRLNYAFCLLKNQHYYQGWVEYEWRLKTPNHSTLPSETLIPTLTKDMDITGKKILITQEEGLGDTLMYLRFVPELIEKGAIVELWVPEELKGLCERIKGHPKVKTGGITTPKFDWHCPFISLPRALSATPNQNTELSPYLSVPSDLIKYWKKQLPQTTQFKIGIIWGGSHHIGDPSSMMMDQRRSITIEKLLPILKNVKNVQFICLQMGDHAKELIHLPSSISLINPMDNVKNMDDTAAIIMNLDLVVSVDTSVVHLAGGLGKPTLLLDRYDNCWRWVSNSEYSPWYPTVRIIRQKHPHIWKDVIKKAISIIQEMANNHYSNSNN